VLSWLAGLRMTTPYSLRDRIRQTFKSRDSSKVGNDEEVAQDVIQNDGQEEGQATDTANSPVLAGSVQGELYVPRQRQPTFAHKPDESTSQSAHTAPAPSADQTASKEKKRSRKSDGTDREKPPLKKIVESFKRFVSGRSDNGPGEG